MDMSEPKASLPKMREITPIIVRVLAASVLGIFISCVLIRPFHLAFANHVDRGDPSWMSHENIGALMTEGFEVFPVGLLMLLPFVLLFCIIAALFRESVQKHFNLWCLITPFAVWFIMGILAALTRDESYETNHNFIENLIRSLSGIDTAFFFFGTLPAVIIFYFLGGNKIARKAPKE